MQMDVLIAVYPPESSSNICKVPLYRILETESIEGVHFRAADKTG